MFSAIIHIVYIHLNVGTGDPWEEQGRLNAVDAFSTILFRSSFPENLGVELPTGSRGNKNYFYNIYYLNDGTGDP